MAGLQTGVLGGLIAVVLVALLVVGALAGLSWQAGEIPLGQELSKPYTWSIIRFTLWQASLSTLISVAAAIPFARALHRQRRFFGRGLLLRLTSVSLIVPTMVAILGVIAVHGRSGWINDLLVLGGFSRQDYLYGLSGILIAHVFFNLPLVTRLLLGGLANIPDYQWKLARLYGFEPGHIFRLIEWPAIRGLLPGAAGIVFLLCFTSFAIVLSLGGGPRSTTLEVAIYQALRFDFDLARAVALSLIQMVICLALAAVFFSRIQSPILGAHDIASDNNSIVSSGKWIDALIITLAAVFLLSPFAAVVAGTLDGNGWQILRSEQFGRALGFSLLISISAGVLSTGLGLAIAELVATIRLSRRPGLGSLPEIIGMLTLLMPPITLGTGLFLLLRQFTDALSLGALLVIAINALFTLAFTLRVLVAPLQQQKARFGRLSQSLGIHGFTEWRLVYWPVMRRPICFALAIATTLAAGDMGVIALFGTDQLSTLPLLIYRLLGSYRLDQAAVVAVCLCALCVCLFWGIERFAGSKQVEHA